LFTVAPAQANTPKLYEKNSTSVSLRWNKVRESSASRTYTVRWTSLSGTDYISGISRSSVTIRGLQLNTEYNFTVTAFNEAGSGLESSPLKILTGKKHIKL